ncbi:hypothetical protein GCK72_018135 [Caenorhabditis remanei]|uniref:Uncharacterized protein n=1 Tax=Caenorhabditis remanei TaxID=31234 RepID=A0A6A5G9Z6_CAERE|nr:hypothetical protein GCK72_018135 [Caenorhabditis remanei]KAF1751581.1 hypothetical protein GCK72_018135 [Caenorhabditis remanei]
MTDTIFGLNKSNVVLAAGVAGAAFLGYCIYCNHKRINALEYKDKIRQKRRTQAGAGGMESQKQQSFVQEVQLGQQLMVAGNVEEGAVHIANAVMLCGESQHFLSIFKQTLSEEKYRAVVQQLSSAREVSI